MDAIDRPGRPVGQLRLRGQVEDGDSARRAGSGAVGQADGALDGRVEVADAAGNPAPHRSGKRVEPQRVVPTGEQDQVERAGESGGDRFGVPPQAVRVVAGPEQVVRAGQDGGDGARTERERSGHLLPPDLGEGGARPGQLMQLQAEGVGQLPDPDLLGPVAQPDTLPAAEAVAQRHQPAHRHLRPLRPARRHRCGPAPTTPVGRHRDRSRHTRGKGPTVRRANAE